MCGRYEMFFFLFQTPAVSSASLCSFVVCYSISCILLTRSFLSVCSSVHLKHSASWTCFVFINLFCFHFLVLFPFSCFVFIHLFCFHLFVLFMFFYSSVFSASLFLVWARASAHFDDSFHPFFAFRLVSTVAFSSLLMGCELTFHSARASRALWSSRVLNQSSDLCVIICSCVTISVWMFFLSQVFVTNQARFHVCNMSFVNLFIHVWVENGFAMCDVVLFFDMHVRVWKCLLVYGSVSVCRTFAE